jgi:hypothetical protein
LLWAGDKKNDVTYSRGRENAGYTETNLSRVKVTYLVLLLHTSHASTPLGKRRICGFNYSSSDDTITQVSLTCDYLVCCHLIYRSIEPPLEKKVYTINRG